MTKHTYLELCKRHINNLPHLVILECDGLSCLGPFEWSMGPVVHLIEPVVRGCEPSLGGGLTTMAYTYGSIHISNCDLFVVKFDKDIT